MIVPMVRVVVLGPRRMLAEALQFVQSQGVLEIRSMPRGLGHGRVRRVPMGDAQVAVEHRLEETARRVRDLLLLLPPTPAAPLEVERLPDVAAADFLSRLETLENEVRALANRRLELEEERESIARYERLITALVPLRSALEGVGQVETVGLLIRRDHPEALSLIEREVSRISHGVYRLVSREVDRSQTAVLLAVPSAAAPGISQLLFERGITEIKLPAPYTNQPPLATLTLLLKRVQEIAREIRDVEDALATFSRSWQAPLEAALREARDRLARLHVATSCGETDHAFLMSGFIPARGTAALARALDRTFRGKIAVAELPLTREEYDDVPVLLDNPRWIRPFELLLSFVPLPRYGSIDPTPFLAVFFPLFFGLMLGDAGFGAVTLALALYAKARRWGGQMGQNLSTIAVVSSASAIGFGVLFGELFGEVGGLIGLRPLLLNRKEGVLPMLALSVGLGGLHILIGMGLGLWAALERRNTREIAIKLSILLLVVTAAPGVLAALGYLPAPVGNGAIFVGAGLLVASVGLGGLPAAVELITGLGNVLSYARLMAFGLASVLLAAVAHRMLEVLHPAPVGVTMAVLLHAVNFVLGLFGPTIQALRLHYVEFFDKFYEPGGKSFEPFTSTA